MSRNDLFRDATKAAERVVRELGITELPVDPLKIARDLDIAVMAMPTGAPGMSGMLAHQGGMFGIAYATHVNSIGFQNFSIAHELGHYYLPGHYEVACNNVGPHESEAGCLSDKRYELEANHFAASLLMPHPLFTAAMRTAGDGIQAIEQLAKTCRTSLTATAIRYVQCSDEHMAVIRSTDATIDFCFMSESLMETDGLTWIRKGQALPKRTVTFKFNQDRNRVGAADRAEGTSDLQDWFGGSFAVGVTEEVQGLGRYGKTLTVIGVPDFLEKLEEFREANMIDDLWKPKLHL